MTDRKNLRERVLALVRRERSRQVSLYGLNRDNELGFGGSVSDHPWLMPYTADPSGLVETFELVLHDRGVAEVEAPAVGAATIFPIAALHSATASAYAAVRAMREPQTPPDAMFDRASSFAA